jgi:hypothetical protein
VTNWLTPRSLGVHPTVMTVIGLRVASRRIGTLLLT